jgi:hypothetical protein
MKGPERAEILLDSLEPASPTIPAERTEQEDYITIRILFVMVMLIVSCYRAAFARSHLVLRYSGRDSGDRLGKYLPSAELNDSRL